MVLPVTMVVMWCPDVFSLDRLLERGVLFRSVELDLHLFFNTQSVYLNC